jgi:hypothetical protein
MITCIWRLLSTRPLAPKVRLPHGYANGAEILTYFSFVPDKFGWLERLTKPPEATRSESLRKWSETVPGATAIADAGTQGRHKVAGVIQTIRINPRQGSGCIEATVIDGTGEIVAKWLGRQSMLGIRLGAGLVMEGVVGVGLDEEKVILNPDYQLVPGPERS